MSGSRVTAALRGALAPSARASIRGLQAGALAPPTEPVMTDPVAPHKKRAPSRKRPPPWRWPILRPGCAERRSGAARNVRIHSLVPWLRAERQPKRRGAATFGAVEIVLAAAAERGATLRPSVDDVQAVLRRLRSRYPPDVARTIAVDGRAARAVLRALRPAMVRCAAGAWRLNRHVIHGAV